MGVVRGWEPIETASRDELESLQLERLRWSVRHAYEHNSRYRAKFDAVGVHPDDLNSLDDLKRFPFTTKADLREAYPFGLFAVPPEQIRRIHASSGTTGSPTVVGYTERDLATWSNLVARSLYAGGARPGMKVHVAYGYGLFTGGLGAHYGAEALGCAVIPMSGGQTEKQVQLILDFEPDVIMATPSYMLTLLDEFARRGADARASSLKFGLLGAEPWSEAMRAEIESSANLQATDIYGLSEVMGPGVAQECVATKDGPTIWEDHFYPEIVDPETGKALPDGSAGELVFTSLTKEGMPVIRYRTRDITRLLPGTARTMRRMQKVSGRADDMLIVRGVNLFPSQIEELILRCPALSAHYQITVRRPGRLDEITLQIEKRRGCGEDQCAAAARQLERLAKELIGVTLAAELLEVGSIVRSSGKATRIRDLRNG